MINLLIRAILVREEKRLISGSTCKDSTQAGIINLLNMKRKHCTQVPVAICI